MGPISSPLNEYSNCRPVINQMDTSQAHLSNKAGTQVKDPHKPDNLSKDELTAVLKYGAQKMYVARSAVRKHWLLKT